MTNQIVPFGIWVRPILEQNGLIEPGQQYIDLDPKEHAAYIKLWEESMKPQKATAPERPVDVGYITNAPRVTMETNAAGNVITNTNSGPIVHQVEKYADGTFKIIPQSVQNFRGGSAEMVAPGTSRPITNETTGAPELNYSSEYSDAGGTATIGAYNSGASASAPAVPPSATTVNTTTAPTVAPPPQAAPQQSAGFVVGRAYRDANGNSRVYTGANPQNPRDHRNWQ